MMDSNNLHNVGLWNCGSVIVWELCTLRGKSKGKNKVWERGTV
jgi:hypothetical protein